MACVLGAREMSFMDGEMSSMDDSSIHGMDDSSIRGCHLQMTSPGMEMTDDGHGWSIRQ